MSFEDKVDELPKETKNKLKDCKTSMMLLMKLSRTSTVSSSKSSVGRTISQVRMETQNNETG